MPKKTRKKTTERRSKNAARASAKAAAKKSASKKPKASSKKPTTPTAVKPSVTKPSVTKAKATERPAKSLVETKTTSQAKANLPASQRTDLTDGAKAPAFRLPRDGGQTVSLADYAGQKLVLFFYPRADTPGCTKEAIDFTRLADSFAKARTAVVGVSADPLKAQESFRNKHRLTVPLASDEKHEMLEAYGVWGEKSMYGKIFQGVLRTTVLIGANGRIIRIWRQVKVDGHADEVLQAAQAA